MINGARISADAKISKSGSTSLTEQIDYRNFPTENIESVEVLKGVLSAEYGDVTSGAIIVKTKTGYTPYEVRVKTDPHTKAIALGKGFSLGEKAGTLNIVLTMPELFLIGRLQLTFLIEQH
jgi:outer membrane receptor protein involved in Fe transport